MCTIATRRRCKFASTRQRRQLLDGLQLTQHTASTLPDRRTLDAELERIRKRPKPAPEPKDGGAR
jgi:DNA-binding IclR family transcriptional regulator